MAELMVVEDEVIISMELEDQLKSMGHDVIGILSRADESIKDAERLRPDLILMDIVTPGNIDGIEAAEIIRRKFNIPVVFVTAWQTDDFLNRAAHAEAYGYIVKPYEKGEIRATIDMALIRKEREQHTKDLSHCTRALLDSIETPIMTINYDFSLCCWNKAASELLEIPEYTGTSHPLLINFIAPSFRNFVTNTIADATKNLKKQQILSHGHATMCTKNGIKRIMDLSFVPMPTNAKTIVSMMAEPHQTGHAKYTKSATICSYCKKLKNSRNGWVPIERFFEHITFSHGICPDCLEHIYPEYL